MEVNGKVYPLWGQFVEKKDRWIGGDLEDFGDVHANYCYGTRPAVTKIKDIMLMPNGRESAFFAVVGEDFTCGFDVHHGGISCRGQEVGWILFEGYGGHLWRIRGCSDEKPIQV